MFDYDKTFIFNQQAFECLGWEEAPDGARVARLRTLCNRCGVAFEFITQGYSYRKRCPEHAVPGRAKTDPIPGRSWTDFFGVHPYDRGRKVPGDLFE